MKYFKPTMQALTMPKNLVKFTYIALIAILGIFAYMQLSSNAFEWHITIMSMQYDLGFISAVMACVGATLLWYHFFDL